jgi:hypothetical protein
MTNQPSRHLCSTLCSTLQRTGGQYPHEKERASVPRGGLAVEEDENPHAPRTRSYCVAPMWYSTITTTPQKKESNNAGPDSAIFEDDARG